MSVEKIDIKFVRRSTAAIVVFAIALRIVAALVWQSQCSLHDTTLKFGDSHSYWTIASNLALEGRYQYGSDQSRIFRSPAYPLFLAPFAWSERWFSDQSAQAPFVLGARIAGCLLGGLAVWIMMRWTRSIAGTASGIFAGLLAATYCGAVGMSIFVLSEAVATPLMVLSCWMLWRSTLRNPDPDGSHFWTSQRWLATAYSAFALGLACLARPSWGLWPGLALPLVAFASNRKGLFFWRNWLLQGMFFFGIMCCVMAPWWVRNYAITGKFVPSTLQVGASLYDGWHPGASGSSDENMAFSIEAMQRILREEALLANESSEVESTLEWRIDRRLHLEAWGWARENPSDALRRGLIKFQKTWWPFPTARELSNPMVVLWEAGSYLFILIMSAVGLWSLRADCRRWTEACWFIAPCVYLALLHMVFVGSVRYRQPGVLILCGLAGIGLSAAWTRFIVRAPVGPIPRAESSADRAGNGTDAVGSRAFKKS